MGRSQGRVHREQGDSDMKTAERWHVSTQLLGDEIYEEQKKKEPYIGIQSRLIVARACLLPITVLAIFEARVALTSSRSTQNARGKRW